MPIWIDCEGCGTNQPTHLPVYPPFWDSGITPPAAPAPTVTGIVPSSADYGSDALYLEVMGTGFNGSSRILLDGVVAPTEYLSPTRLRTLLQPALVTAATPVVVTVHNAGVAATGSKTFNYTDPPAPVVEPHITDVNPTGMETDDPDTTVHIMGTNFTDTTEVYVNGTPVETTHVSDTELTYVAKGDSVGAHTVTVGAPTMRSGSAVFTVTAPVAPALTLTDLIPRTAVDGTPTQVRIIGTGFTPATTVTASLEPIAATFVSETELTYLAPTSGTGIFAIEVHEGAAKAGPISFTVTAPAAPDAPTITGMVPNSLLRTAGATSVTVSGTGFVSGTTVVLCNTKTPPEYDAGSVMVLSATSLLLTVWPANDTYLQATNNISVRNGPAGSPESNAVALSITEAPAGPTINSLAPTGINRGDAVSVYITGSGFDEGSVILCATKTPPELGTTRNGTSQIIFTTTAADDWWVLDNPITVRNSAGVVSNEKIFKVYG